MLNTVKYKNDGKLRKRFFHESAMSHPAKLHGGFFLEIMERYTQAGDWIADPMGGIGTAMLATMYGRNVIINEMESHFIETMPKSWAKMRSNGPGLGHTMGEVLVVRGDARCLPIGSADSAIFSPPYEASEVAQSSDGEANRRFRDGNYKGDALKGMGLSKGYTRPQAIITSPPYEGTRQDGGGQLAVDMEGSSLFGPYTGEARNQWHTQRDQTNIGNQRGTQYWESMRLCYLECLRVLRPGGVMALILAGFTRDGLYVDLPSDTMEMCKSLGFEEYDHWLREKWSLSFWRILQKRKGNFDERLNFEHVWVFKKPLHGLG